MNALKKATTLLLIPVVILLMTWGTVTYLMKTKPEPERSSPNQIIPSVEVLNMSPGTHTPWIDTFGTVRSYDETEIASLIAGEIINVDKRFQAGESVKKGDILVELNPADYLANVAQQKAAVSKAKETLLTEQARGRIATSDWKSSGRKLEDASRYTLRIPQQEAAQHGVDSAEATLAKAELNLRRTKIRAPYDAIVQTRQASPGSIVGIGTPVGRLIAREKAEVRLPLNPEQVVQLKLPLAFRHSQANQGASNPPLEVKLTSPAYPAISWMAKITRTEASVDVRNQVVYVVAEIDAPFDPPGAPLPIGTFVKAHMQGKELADCLSLPESSIIDDHYIWIIDHDSQLRRQDIQRLYNSKGMVLARLPEGSPHETLTISKRPLPSFRSGQEVKVITQAKITGPSKEETKETAETAAQNAE